MINDYTHKIPTTPQRQRAPKRAKLNDKINSIQWSSRNCNENEHQPSEDVESHPLNQMAMCS